LRLSRLSGQQSLLAIWQPSRASISASGGGAASGRRPKNTWIAFHNFALTLRSSSI
jgi:hypothetical protein